MPPQAAVATRGAAAVPTEGHWADPPPRSFESVMLKPPNPAAVAEAEYQLKLMQAQLASEKRMRMAALALAADKLAAVPNGVRDTSGALTARF